MKIGILLCGDVPAELIDRFGNYAQCLQSQFSLNLYGTVKVWNVYQDQHFPIDEQECDVYLIGGSPAGVHDELQWLKRLTQFIRLAFHAKKKLFGICFGHQVINHALGGKVQRTLKGWGLGAYEVRLNEHIGDFKAGQALNLIAMHQDQVVTPGKHFDVLAGNEFCPNYITRYHDQLLTVQGHPEFTGLFFNALLNQRRNIFTADEIERAMIREEHSINSSQFNMYVQDFLFA